MRPTWERRSSRCTRQRSGPYRCRGACERSSSSPFGAVWAADYEFYAHRALGEAAGLAPADVAALADGMPAEALDAVEQAAQRFTSELAKDRRVSDATYRAAEEALGRERVVAATFLAGLYGLTCALLNAFAVPVPVADA